MRVLLRFVLLVAAAAVSIPLVCGVLVGTVMLATRTGFTDPIWRGLDGVLPSDGTDDGFRGIVLVSIILSVIVGSGVGGFLLRRSWVNSRAAARFVLGRSS